MLVKKRRERGLLTSAPKKPKKRSFFQAIVEDTRDGNPFMLSLGDALNRKAEQKAYDEAIWEWVEE